MEARFDHDFSAVRVHTDAAAAHAAREHLAKAYTIGNDIVFGANQFAPATHDGHQLIAHELAHVIQQRRGGEPGSAVHEDDADTAARAVVNGSTARVMAGSAHGVPQLTPEGDLNATLRLGPNVEPPTAEEVANALGRINSGKSTQADHIVIVRQAVAETRAYIQADAGRPLSYATVKDCCGAGRDVSAASLGELASGSPTDITVARFQSSEVFGANKHGFTVITFKDGRKYLVDPTFAQFFHPESTKDAQAKTANVLRGDGNSLRFANELVRNGFVELDETSARLYARGLGVERGRESGAAARLLANKKAELIEPVGRGKGTVFHSTTYEPDILDRRDLRSRTEDRINRLRTEGDPYNLRPQLERLETRLQPPQVSALEPQARTVQGEIGGSKTTPPPPLPPTTSGTSGTTATTTGTSSVNAYKGAPLQPIVEATPGFNPGAGSQIGNAIQVLQSRQFAGLQGDEVEKFLKRYAQLQTKIEKFFQQGYSVEVALIVEKPDRPDVMCAAGAFCDSSQIIYFRDIFITRVESTAPPRFPTNREYSQMYPTGGRDSFIPYTHQGGSIIEEHEIPHLTPIHADHHTEYKKETFYPPPAFSFSVARSLPPPPPPPPPKPKLDLATKQKLAAAPATVYLVPATIKQARTADVVEKRLAGHRSFGTVKQSFGGLFSRRTRVIYWSTLEKARAEELADLVRAAGVPSATSEQSDGGQGDPGYLQVNFGEDAARD